MTWWHWLVAGMILVLLEMAISGGFYVIFFGVAALVIGSLHLFGIAGPPAVQLLLFSVLSVGSLLIFRSPLMRWLKLDQGSADVDSLHGEVGVALDEMAAGQIGRVELRGSVWTARNASASSIARGNRCVVIRVDRLTLFVQPEGVIS
jgi:inner membrane protein